MLINVKMPTIVGIFKFIYMINTEYESLNERKVLIFQHFSLFEQLKFYAQLSLYNFEACSNMYHDCDV